MLVSRPTTLGGNRVTRRDSGGHSKVVGKLEVHAVSSRLVCLLALLSATPTSGWSMVAYGDSLTSDPAGDSFKWCGDRIELPDTCEPRGTSLFTG